MTAFTDEERAKIRAAGLPQPEEWLQRYNAQPIEGRLAGCEAQLFEYARKYLAALADCARLCKELEDARADVAALKAEALDWAAWWEQGALANENDVHPRAAEPQRKFGNEGAASAYRECAADIREMCATEPGGTIFLARLLRMREALEKRSKCPTCGGDGQVLTYAQRDGRQCRGTVICPTCNGTRRDPEVDAALAGEGAGT